MIHEEQWISALSVIKKNSHLKSQGQSLYIMKKGQNLPEAAEENYLQTQNESTDTLRLLTTEQEVQNSTRAVKELCLEAREKDAVIAKSEKEYIQ